MHTNNSHIAKTPLSQPVEKAAEGASKTAQKKFGFMASEINVPDDFDTIGGDAIRALFEAGD